MRQDGHLLHNKKLTIEILFLLLSLIVFSGKSWAKDQTFPRPKGLVNDFAGIISDQYEVKINSICRFLLQNTGIPIVVVTIPHIRGWDYNEYANLLYEKWGIGKKGEDKGVLIFITLKERKMRIEVGYGLEGIITDGTAGEIRDRFMLPYLKRNRFGEGILNGVKAIASIIAKEYGLDLSKIPLDMGLKKVRKKRNPIFPFFFPLIFFILVPILLSRRGGRSFFFFPFFFGFPGPTRYSGGLGGGFGPFSGGLGGFGGGMSGGGGAGGSF